MGENIVVYEWQIIHTIMKGVDALSYFRFSLVG